MEEQKEYFQNCNQNCEAYSESNRKACTFIKGARIDKDNFEV